MRSLFRWLALALVLGSSCSRNSAEPTRRLAILPPEILIDDPSSEWLSTALPIVWEEDLAPARHLLFNLAADGSAAAESGATEVLRTTVENRNGRLRFEGTITDAVTQRNREVFSLDAAASAGVLPLANEFARHVDSAACRFSTTNEEGFKIFVRAVRETNPPARVQDLNGAINLDPGFGLAYIVLAQTNPQQLSDLLSKAGQHIREFTALDRAKFNALAAGAVHAPISQQAIALRTLLQIAPNNLDAMVELASLRFLEDDTDGGERLMARALELSPGNVNVRQQLARGLIESKQFAKAEKVLDGLENSPAILPTLATCILLEGDTRRATTFSNRFSESVQPGVQILYRASWLAISGNTAGAIAALAGQHFADPNLQSAAVEELVTWHLMQRDFAGAKQALASAPSPAGVFTPQAILLSAADAPVEQWQSLVESSTLSAEQKQTVLAYGFFLAGHYDQAAPIWQQILARSGGTDLRARAMFVASLDRTTVNPKELVEPFVPEFGDLYAAVSFAEMRHLLNLQVH